jgi:hypothetical protein
VERSPRLIAGPTTGQLLREHRRTRRDSYQIHNEDRPARTPPTTLALPARAMSAGPHTGAVCPQIHQHDGVATLLYPNFATCFGKVYPKTGIKLE